MKNIHFKLRAQGKADPTIILQIFDARFKGRKFMYSTGKSIEPSLWLKKKERVKIIPARQIELNELNEHLERLYQYSINFIASKHNSKTILREDLKTQLNLLKVDEEKEQIIKQKEELRIAREQLEKENDFFATWENIIKTTRTKDGLPISESTCNR